MRLYLGAVTAVMLIVMGAERVGASSILYFVDGNNGTDEMAAALAALSPPNTVTIASSPTDFATKIATGTYGLGIFSAQKFYGPDYSAALAALSTRVQSGGRAIVDSWFTPSGSDITPFGATPTGNVAPAPNSVGVNLTALNSGITNPVSVAQQTPPYAVYATGLSLAPITGDFIAGTFSDPGNLSGTNGEAAVVVGNSGKSIVNGFLNDTAGAKGEQLYENEINDLLAPPSQTATPLPATSVAGTALLACVGLTKLKSRLHATR